jgi:hypothetical protein
MGKARKTGSEILASYCGGSKLTLEVDASYGMKSPGENGHLLCHHPKYQHVAINTCK